MKYNTKTPHLFAILLTSTLSAGVAGITATAAFAETGPSTASLNAQLPSPLGIPNTIRSLPTGIGVPSPGNVTGGVVPSVGGVVPGVGGIVPGVGGVVPGSVVPNVAGTGVLSNLQVLDVLGKNPKLLNTLGSNPQLLNTLLQNPQILELLLNNSKFLLP